VEFHWQAPASYENDGAVRPVFRRPGGIYSMSDELAQLTHSFLDAKARSATTRRMYGTTLRHFQDFCSDLQSALDPATVTAFLAYEATHLKTSTLRERRAALSSFFNWAYREQHISSNPMMHVMLIPSGGVFHKTSVRSTVEAVLMLIPHHQCDDRLLFRLMAETGLRLAEIASLSVEDFDLTHRHLYTPRGQEAQRRIFLDNPEVVDEIQNYLKARSLRSGCLFDAEKMRTAGQRWSEYCEAAGVICTLTALRHVHRQELIAQGAELSTRVRRGRPRR